MQHFLSMMLIETLSQNLFDVITFQATLISDAFKQSEDWHVEQVHVQIVCFSSAGNC